jgi:Holliday junction resolvase RusA-like endonuclease
MYSVKEDTHYREKLYFEAKKLNMKPIPRMTPLFVEILVYRPIPKSISTVKAQMAEEKHIRPTTKPDIDNYIKQIFDALNGLVWEDDAQIVTVLANKFFSRQPRLEIEISELTPR